MNKMVAFSKAAPGRKAELAAWYDERHLPDLLAVPGFVSAERHEIVPVKPLDGLPAWDFMLVYEIEGDPMAVLRGMAGLFGSERMPLTDALESASSLSVVGVSAKRLPRPA